MYITQKYLSRRTVLRGLGATLALPLLDSMIPAQTPLAKTAAKPSPLPRAAKAGDAEAIRWLLEKGANPNVPNINGITPVVAAAGLGSRDSDTRGRYKTESDGIDSLKLLLAAGGEVNAADDRGQTAMHGAAFRGWDRMVQLLAERGCKLDVKDNKGMTPIDSAMGRAGGNGFGGNGFGGNRIDIHESTTALLKKLLASAAPSAQNNVAKP